MIAQLNIDYIKTSPLASVRRLLSYALFEGRALTTRGRWINPLVFFMAWCMKNLPGVKTVKGPIFIVGTGRSGSTILGSVLSMHREVGFLNEPKAMWYSVHKDDDINGNYQSTEGRIILGGDDATEKIIKRARRLYSWYSFLTGSKRVLDKYPEMVYRVEFVKKIFPDAKFIFLVRDGFDTVVSIDKWSKRLGVKSGGETHDWWGRDNLKWKSFLGQLLETDDDLKDLKPVIKELKSHNDMASVEWIVAMRYGLKYLKENEDSFLKVRYEDLTENPEETLTKVCSFAGLSEDKRFLSYAVRLLEKNPHSPSIKLHKEIEPIFYSTLKELGYRIDE